MREIGRPRVRLLAGPTALEPMPALGAAIGLPKLYVKRDDEGGRGGGGNKLRKFEWQFADALARGCDTVVLAAHPQSNAARELAGVAPRVGLKTVIVTRTAIPRNTPSFRMSGNRMLLDLLGSELIAAPPDLPEGRALAEAADAVAARGGRPYVLPFGASDPLGALGYVICADEIVEQVTAAEGRPPDVIVLPTGTGGTHAGLLVGLARYQCTTRVLGSTILHEAERAAEIVRDLASATSMVLETTFGVGPAIEVDGRARGDGYGLPTEATFDAIRLAALTEGLFFDPVYTGKALAGLVELQRSTPLASDAIVVFLHTGGLPLLFAYSDAFGPGE